MCQNIKLPNESAISLLDRHQKDFNSHHRDTQIAMYIAILYTIAKKWVQARWLLVDKNNVAHTCNGILVSINEN